MGHSAGFPYGPLLVRRYRGRLTNQGRAAERLALRFGLNRDSLDHYAAISHHRAAVARENGELGCEIEPIPEGPQHDDGIRDHTSKEQLAALKPSFVPGGMITAGNSSQISDGAAAALLMAEDVAIRRGYRAVARIVEHASVGVDPVEMLTGPMAATHRVLSRAGLQFAQIDLFEVNEAFAAVVLAWAIEFGVQLTSVNRNGGAISLGHPLGCTGVRLLGTIVKQLHARSLHLGLQTMCEAGGTGSALIVERIP